MDTQAVLGNHGAPFQITWRGVTYSISYKVQRVKAEFERYAKQKAIRDLSQFKEAMGQEEYQRRLDTLLERITAEEFAFNGDECKRLMGTTDGALAMFRILLGKEAEKLTDGELLLFFAEHGDEVIAFSRACSSRIDRIKKDVGGDENPDPKALSLALAEAGML